MSKWSILYEREIKNASSIENYVKQKLVNKKKLIKLINKYSRNHKILELGSGTGVLALYLSTLNFEVTALDRDIDMIQLSKRYFLNSFKKANIKYICNDINNFKNTYMYDICYSIGVLEHYNDDEIIQLIQKQLKICKYVIFGIPTKYFDEDKKMYGNERYLPLKYWRKLIEKSNCKIVEESSYHYLNFIQRLLNYHKYFKPNPVHIFVVSSK